LAEVLITLAIIGVIAAITIPSIVANHQKKELETQFAKSYRTLSQAVSMAVAEHGGFDFWEWKASYTSEEYDNYLKIFTPYLNVVKFCSAGETSKEECFPSVTYKLLNGGDHYNYTNWRTPTIILADGSTILHGILSTTYALPMAYFAVDINGAKKPNIYGRDLFQFMVFPQTQELSPLGFYNLNAIDDTTGFFKKRSLEEIYEACNANSTGSGCPARIVADGFKMNY